jgi:alginate O-acetyltransferase complex protein AlgI
LLFNSGIFAVFFAIFLPLFLLLRRNLFARNLLLLLASYVFYGWWDVRFLVLVATSTAVDFLVQAGAGGARVTWRQYAKSAGFLVTTTACALALAGKDLWIVACVVGLLTLLALARTLLERVADDGKRRRYWLALSIGTNLGILGFFKYFNFFVDSFASLLEAAGVPFSTSTLSIILPVGLSFYTFQGLACTIDSYRGRIQPRHHIVTYASYLAFFPQLVAGPIERPGRLLPQFESIRPLDWENLWSGARLFLWGLFLKLVIADNVAPISDALFTSPASQTAGATLAGILAFTFQIYCDFCGYSNMARGLARMLGFELMVNFNLPYFSRTPSEFWQRWHISLSSWLRDYLYVGLGGNREGKAKTYRNLVLTMLLGGLWHGAAWTFVIWGAFHGAVLVLYRVLGIDAIIERTKPNTAGGVATQVSSWLAMMIFVMIGWVFFRAVTFSDAMTVLGGVLGTDGYDWATFGPLLLCIVPLVLVEMYQRFSQRLEVLEHGPFFVRYTAATMLVLAVIALSAAGGREFIYFDF